MRLTDTQLRKVRPAEKSYKLTDSGGLHLLIAPSGSRTWRWKYRLKGLEKLLTIGSYPETSIVAARTARDEARAALRAGNDPAEVKRQRQADRAVRHLNTFESVAREWHRLQCEMWSETHAYDVMRSLERDVFPEIGQDPIQVLGSHTGARTVLAMLKKIEKREARETAHRVRQRVSAVFVFGIASSLCETDPAAIVRQALAPIIRGRQPAIINLDEAKKMIAVAEAAPAHPVTKLAHRLLAITAVRPGALITTPWTELNDLDPVEPLWQISAARMKLLRQYKDDEARDHLVPLPWQAVEIIAALKTLTGRGVYVVQSGRSSRKPMSENTIGYFLNRAGYHGHHVPHGWRSTFSTIMNERYPADRHIIDLMLAHVPENKVEGAYNRAAYLPRRRELAQLWADLIIDGLPPALALLDLPRR